MRKEIIQCLHIVMRSNNTEVLAVMMSNYLKSSEAQDMFLKEVGHSREKKKQIVYLPIQDTFWLLKEVILNEKDLSHFRLLVLFDCRSSGFSPIQFSYLQSDSISYEDQSIQLFYQSCFFPLDNRKQRRPRILCTEGEEYNSVTLQQEIERNGIVFSEKCPSQDELVKFKQNFNCTNCFRQCGVCGISATSSFFDECEKCKAVLYCSESCAYLDWEESHEEWCSYFKQFMNAEADLGDLPFDYAVETTRTDFDEIRRMEFLRKHGIFEEVQTIKEKLDIAGSNYVSRLDAMSVKTEHQTLSAIEAEISLLSVAPPLLSRPLANWRDYYALRGYSSNSLMAIYLHFSLTLHHIICNLLPQEFPDFYDSILQSKKVCVHVIGAEKEVQMFYEFLECARLLAPFSFQLHMFGNNIDDSYDGKMTRQENLCFQCHKGLYHKAKHECIPKPDLVVCFNGGIGAYKSYIKTIKFLMSTNTPFYYTDYGQACITFSSRMITQHKAGQVSQPIINPFRCPLRLVMSDQNLPRYRNAFISHIKPMR